MAQYWMPQPPRAGVVPLRPLRPGEILGGAFATLGRYGGRLLGALLLGQAAALLPVAVIAGAATLASLSRSAGSRVFVYALLPTAALFLLFGCALAAALVSALLRPAVLGRPVSVPGLLRAAAPRVPAVFGTQLLVLLAVAGPAAALLAAGLPAAALLPLVPVALWLGVLLALAPTAAGYEGLGPAAAVRRSARLVRGAWWRTFAVTVPAGVLAAGAAAAVVLWLGALGALIAPALLLTLPQLAAGLHHVDRRLRHGISPA
ncbi:hypothetical protein ACFWBF_10390 [Streptomyces sp. NPDC060028]|uniref:hypothetical protein n=1 Tax=Streptomyces sp. NPDC060028 TaxID=3347041 RepID=UPI0036C1CAD4